MVIKCPLDSRSVMTVALQEEFAPIVFGVLFGVPLPMIEIPTFWGTVIPVVQVQEPAGI